MSWFRKRRPPAGVPAAPELPVPVLEVESENTFYPAGLEAVMNGEINWLTDDIRVMLCTYHYWPGEERYMADIAEHEVRGTGYKAGGQPLTGRTVVTTEHGDQTVCGADTIRWTRTTLYARYAVVYRDTGDPATSLLICCARCDPAVDVAAGTFTLRWSTGGVVSIPARVAAGAMP